MTPQIQTISDPVLKHPEETVPKTTKTVKKTLPVAIPVPLPKAIKKQETLSRSTPVVPLFVPLSTQKPISESIQSVSLQPVTERIVHQEVKATTPKSASCVINEDKSVKPTKRKHIGKEQKEATLSLNSGTTCKRKPIDRSVHQERNTTGSPKRLSVSNDEISKNTSDHKLNSLTSSKTSPSKIRMLFEKIGYMIISLNEDQVVFLIKSELVLGLVYLLLSLLMVLGIKEISILFCCTGCAFLLAAYLQLIGNKRMKTITLTLSFVSIGLIALWIIVYVDNYEDINSSIFQVLVYFLFTVCIFYLPVVSGVVFYRSIKNKSPVTTIPSSKV